MLKLIGLVALYFLGLSINAQSDYINTITKNRTDKNISYQDTIHSPLNKDSISNFKGLNYYEVNEDYKVTAKFKKKIGENFMMTTSSGRLKEFRRYGFAKFKLNGKKIKLPIYQNLKLMKTPLFRDYIFVPFTDLTNGVSTYGAGRYIETKIPKGKVIVLDFNECFNPYCHYSDGYNCPIPPSENVIDTEICAGEKLLYGF